MFYNSKPALSNGGIIALPILVLVYDEINKRYRSVPRIPVFPSGTIVEDFFLIPKQFLTLESIWND